MYYYFRMSLEIFVSDMYRPGYTRSQRSRGLARESGGAEPLRYVGEFFYYAIIRVRVPKEPSARLTNVVRGFVNVDCTCFLYEGKPLDKELRALKKNTSCAPQGKGPR